MTGNKFLLDTNIVIEIFDGNKEIADKLNNLSEFYISAVVAGELYIGVNRVANKTKHLKKLNDFLELCTVLNTDIFTAQNYGEVVAALYKKGKPLPVNDLWIAATALQHNLTLVTRDKHFNEIRGLKIKAW
jgi:tRNA(fMet)-specific endonuclease VapC